MKYIDLEHISNSLDNQVKALSDYKALVDQQIEAANENLDTYKNDNAFNLLKLGNIVANGVTINDLNEDLQNSILTAKNAGIDVTELVNKDIYLETVKANKDEVYSKNESDRKMSDFYTKNEIDEKVTSLSNSFNKDDSINELNNSFNAYRADSELMINELSKQLNSLKSSLPDVHNISSIETLNDLELEIGTELDGLLKENVTVTLDNDEIRNVSVTWQTNSYNKNQDGIYKISGVLNLPNDISNTNNLYPVIKIVLMGDALSVKSVAEIDDIAVEYGSSSSEVLAKLPSEVDVVLSDDSITKLTVSWNMSYYSSTSISNQTITGKLNEIDGVINSKELKASAKIYVINHDIVSSESVEQTYERNYSIEFNFPQYMNVILDNGSSKSLPITWDTSNIDTTVIGETTIIGTFDNLPINITNSNNVVGECHVNIIENQNNISLVSKIADVEVPLNTDFDTIDIDKELQVTLENGNTTTVQVNWEHDGYNGSVPGSYTIYGKLVTGTVTNFNNFTIECVIVVKEEEYIDYAWSHKFIVPSGASQITNFQAKLGEEFTEDDFYGPYDENNDDYDYSKRKIEIYYLGSTLQNPDEDTIILDKNILASQIKKTGITDLYGSNGLLVPLGSQSNEIKDLFDTKVAAGEEGSNRSIDFYAGDLLIFENKVSSNQIFLIRKTKHSYVK